MALRAAEIKRIVIILSWATINFIRKIKTKIQRENCKKTIRNCTEGRVSLNVSWEKIALTTPRRRKSVKTNLKQPKKARSNFKIRKKTFKTKTEMSLNR